MVLLDLWTAANRPPKFRKKLVSMFKVHTAARLNASAFCVEVLELTLATAISLSRILRITSIMEMSFLFIFRRDMP